MKNKNQLYDINILSNPLINDPIYEIITNNDDIKNIYKEIKYRNKKIYYFSREKIHKILHKSQNYFCFEENQDLKDISNNLSELFYLSLLVLNNGECDYIYSFNYIKLIYDYLKNDENNIKQYKNQIILIILNCIIENFKDIDEYKYEEMCEIKYKNLLQEMDSFILNNLNYHSKKKIDVIYLEIIISLIKNRRFNDYKSCYDLIKDLDLENIDITPTIFDGLSKTLNSEEEYMEFYKLKSDQDIKNETKINFYYILVIFILKNSIYIYNIEFLYRNIKSLRKIIHELRVTIDDNTIQSRIIEILKSIEFPNSMNKISDSKTESSADKNYSLSFSNELSNYKNNNNSNRDFSSINDSKENQAI